MAESSVQADVRLALGRDAVLFRNNTGALRNDYGRLVHFGVGPDGGGGSDLIGWKSITITPDMIGQRVAVFLAIETKDVNGRTAKKRLEAQAKFIKQVQLAGGLAGFARSEDDARAIIRMYTPDGMVTARFDDVCAAIKQRK